MILFLRVVVQLWLLIGPVYSMIESDSYLMGEFDRVIRSKYASEMEKPLTGEMKNKIDGYFHAAPFLNEDHQKNKRRTRRSAEEVKQEQLLLDGISDYGSIPVDFPKEICMFQVEDLEYAAVIHSTNITDLAKSTRLSIFRMIERRDYIRVYNETIPHIVSLDCISFGTDGFVAAAVNIRAENDNANSYSPVIRVQKDDKVQILEKRPWEMQRTARLWKYGNDLFLMYTFENDLQWGNLSSSYICPILKYSAGSTFEIWSEISCSNAIRVEAFIILSDMYLAVANSRDRSNNTETYTIVYKYDLNQKIFVKFQEILVNRIVDIRHFTFKINGEVCNFLAITSATLIDSNEVAEIEAGGYSVIIIYKYEVEIFLPMQNIFVKGPTQVLPHIWENREMVLLVATEPGPVVFYHYIGWRFEDTRLAEMPSAFDTGVVSNLRNYVNAKGDSLIVLSNTEQFGTNPNLFKVHFKLDEDPDLYQGILKWCEDTVQELGNFDYDKVLADLEAIQAEQQKILKELVLNTSLVLNGENMTIDKIIADHIQNPTFHLKETEHHELEKVQEIMSIMEQKLIKINETIARSMTKADQEEKQRNAETRHISLDELEVNEIETELMNGITLDMWAHSDQNLFVETLEVEELTVQNLVQINQYDGVLEKALKISGDQILDFPVIGQDVNVNHLEVGESLNGNDIHAIDATLRQVSTDRHEISVDHVHVKNVQGLVNGKDFRELDATVLKSTGDQTINGWSNIDNIIVGNNAEIIGKVSGKSLSNLVTINEQEHALHFDKGVGFEQAEFDDLHVRGRIGNIRVKRNGGFDLLLKRSNKTQFMRGETMFDSVRLLEPITLHGKLTDSGLNRMNPNVVVDGDVELLGNYEISGPVAVKRRLASKNVVTSDGQRSLEDLNSYGVRMNQEVVLDGDIVFHQPIEVDQLNTYSVGEIPIGNLLKGGLKPGQNQIVTGKKRFTSPVVTVEGSVVAKNVNGIDIEEFSRSVMTKTGEQNITGNIQFNTIHLISVNADYVTIGGRDIRHFYSQDKDIHVRGTVYMDGKLKAKDKLQIGALFPSKPVFKYNFTEVVHDTVFRHESLVKVMGKKIFRDRLEIKNLHTNGSLSMLSNVPADGIVRLRLDGDLNVDEIRCRNAFVYNDVNGVRADQFGHSWLTVEGDQIFSEHQTFNNLQVDSIAQYGNLEEQGLKYDINNAMKNTYLTNRREVIHQKTIFEYVMEVKENLHILGQINNRLRIPDDVILRNASVIDELRVEGGDVRVQRDLILNGMLNDISLDPLYKLTLNEDSYMPCNLVINGSLEFLREPLIENFGNVNIESLYESAWMLYHSRDIYGDVDFEELQLDADINGKVNGRDLPHFVANRFSLREPQIVVSRLHFSNEVVTHGVLKTKQLWPGEFLGIGESYDDPINLRIFAQNALRKDVPGLQTISGEWKFNNLNIDGDLNGIRIGGFDPATDIVLRKSNVNFITGKRVFNNVHIKNLFCGEFCYFQNVNMNSWLHQTVYQQNNHTIQGTTILESPEVPSNLHVFGFVNGRPFNRDTVLSKTQNQYLNVSLYLNNQFADQIHQLSVQRLDTESINRKRIWEGPLDESVFVTRRMGEENVVVSPIEFEKKLVVDNLNLQGDTLFSSQMRDVQLNMGMRRLLEEQTRAFQDLLHVVSRATERSSGTSGVVVATDASPIGGRFVKYFQVFQRIYGGDIKYLEPMRRHSRATGAAAGVSRHEFPPKSPSSGITDYVLAMVDDAEGGKLTVLAYQPTDNQFAPVSVVDFTTRILALKTLATADGRQIVFLQSRDDQLRGYRNHLLAFDGHRIKFEILYEFQTTEQISVALVPSLHGDLLVQYSIAMNVVDLSVIKWISGDRLALERHSEIFMKGVKDVVQLGSNTFAMLLETNRIEIWRQNVITGIFENRFILPISSGAPISLATIVYLEHHLIAVHCAGNIVELFLSAAATTTTAVDNNLVWRRFQTLQIHDAMLQLRFVIMTTGELMLVVSTANRQRPLIVYRYAGVSLFVERMGYSTLGISGRRISDLIIGADEREPRNFMIMVDGGEAVILEAITER